MAHRIRNSLISGCPEPAHSHQYCQSSAWLSLSVHHWLWNRFYPQYSNEIHRTSSVRKSLETREKNSPKTGKTGQPGAFYLLCDLYNRDRYAGSSTGTGGNIRKHSEKKIEENIPVFQKWIDNVFGNNPEVVKWAQSLDIEPGKIIDSVLGVLKNGVNNIVSSTVSITMGLLTTAMNVSIGFVFACYVLLQKEKLLQQIKKAMYAMFPEKPVRYLAHVWNLANRIFSSFITGQCIEAVILGSMFFVSMTILHFPYAMLVGVLISFTALIPLFGGIIGCWVAFFLILMISPVKAVLFLGLFLILQQIEGNLIYPHVVGGSVGLPSIWVLVAVTLGGSLMGIAGMLIFIPTVSVIYTLFREWVYARLEKKQLVL